MRWISAVLLSGFMATLTWTQTTTQPKTKDPKKGAPEPPKKAPSEVPKLLNKSFDQWLKEIALKDPSKRETAIRAVCAFPPDVAVKALPVILAELKKHGPSTPVDLSVRCNLCMALGELLGSGEKIDVKVKNDAVLQLRKQLNDPQAILKFRALGALGAMGDDAKAAINDVADLLRYSVTWEVRQAAAAALGAIAHGDEKTGPPIGVLKSLYGLLQDPAAQVRMAAVHSLSSLGPPLNDEALLENYVNSLKPVATDDPEPGLQIWARMGIMYAINDFANINMDPIAKHANSVDPAIRAQAIQALGTLGEKAKTKVRTVINSLVDEDPTVQATAIWAAGRMGIYAVDALPILDKLAMSPNSPDYLKRAAKEAGEKITKGTK
jgi:HEAT repeat protein